MPIHRLVLYSTLASLVLAFFRSVPAIALNVNVQATTVAPETVVRARVDVAGPLLVESDLAASSSQEIVGPDGTISIGPARSPGLFIVRVTGKAAGQSSVIAVLVTRAGTSLLVESFAVGPALQQPVSTALIDRLINSVKKDHHAALKAAGKKAAAGWLAKNAVGASATIIVCLTPGAGLVCVARIGDHVVDLSMDFMGELVDASDLDATSKKELRKQLQFHQGIIDITRIVRADRPLDLALAAINAGTNVATYNIKDKGGNDTSVSVISNNFTGLVDKYAVTLQILRK